MGKTVKILIRESLSELKILKSKQKTLKAEKRIECFILLKSSKFKTQQQTADYLGVERRTITNWIGLYRKGGIDAIILKMTRNKKSKIINSVIHRGLLAKVSDFKHPFLGYWDAQEWVYQQYGVQIKYHWLRQYLIKHFKTKLKTPRKSHYKKDEQAVEAFLKTP